MAAILASVDWTTVLVALISAAGGAWANWVRVRHDVKLGRSVRPGPNRAPPELEAWPDEITEPKGPASRLTPPRGKRGRRAP